MTLGVVGYAAGHASLAVSAGVLGTVLTRSPGALPLEPPSWPFGSSLSTLFYFGLGAAIVKTISSIALGYAETRLGADVTNRIRVSSVSRLLASGSMLAAPRFLAVLTVRLKEIEAAVEGGILKSWRASVQLIPLVICGVVISPRLAACALVVIAPFGVWLSRARSRARRATSNAQLLATSLEEGVDELVRNTDLFRAYGAGERMLAAVDRAGHVAGLAAARADMGRAALSGANEVLAALAILGAALVSSRFGFTSLNPSLLPFAAVFFMSYRPLRDLGDARARVQRGAVAYEAVHEAVNGARGAELTKPRAQPWPAQVPIRLRDFGAAERGPTVSLDLLPGEIVGLVGRTGSGKTTLFRAMLGLEAARGELTVGGVAVANGVGPRHRPFAWVPQEAPLVTGTVADNVTLLGGDDARVERALAEVGATRLAAMARTELVGPAERPLSGGERRQVSLARALVTDLPVLLLDEPTEGLDPEATRAVLAAIAALAGKRTVFVATHRADVLTVVDRVVRLDDGTTSLAAE